MQKLAEICIRRPVFASMIVLSLVVVGAAGFFRLGVDRFPSVDLPTVSIRIGLPGAAPEEVESLVTQQVEEVVNTVDGISELRSVSGQGSSIVIAAFKLRRENHVHEDDGEQEGPEELVEGALELAAAAGDRGRVAGLQPHLRDLAAHGLDAVGQGVAGRDARAHGDLALAVEYVRHLPESDRESLSELIRQRQAEFAEAVA